MTDWETTVQTTSKGIELGIRIGSGGARVTMTDEQTLDLIDRLQGALVWKAIDRKREAHA